MSTDQLAFVGAEGYGANTSGGRGGAVITVTNLNDSGVGSLRWALEDNSGPRTIVFAVNGTIHLDSQILIQNGDVTIAGQTSAGDGITIEGSRIRVKADNVIVRGMHFRPGDSANGQAGGDRDGIMVGTTDFQQKNVIIDHNSFEWATDENVDIQGNVTNITVSNNIIASGLSHSINPEGEHSKGLLISNWSSTDSAYDTNISVIKNLFANNMDRNPEVRAGQNIEIINNYTYDAGYGQHTIAIGAGNNGTLVTTASVIGNVVEAGKSTQKVTSAPVALSTMADGSGVFISDNLWTKLTADANGNNAQSALTGNLGGGQYATATAIFAGSKVNILDSTQVKSYVLANVGANAGHWDAVDQAVINGVINGTGAIIDSVAQAGGPMAQTAVQAAVDTDKDGMPNWFEDLYGFNSKVADGNADADKDGYTNLEEYINGLISGFDLPLAKTVVLTSAAAGKADTFVMNTNTLSTPMSISNFNAAEGDRIDVSSLLTNYHAGVDKLTDFLNLTVVDGTAVLTVDRDGAGSAYVAQVLATISNGSGLVLSNTIKGATVTDNYTGIAASSTAAINAGTATTSNTTVVTTPTGTYATQTGTSQMETLTGAAGADHLLGVGGNDSLYGGSGNDWLEGGEGNDLLDGGAGADILTGGNGSDTYVVDDIGDVVTEGANAGTDEVKSSITYVLGANLENLTLTGVAAINGTGNSLGNIITGNDAANTLSGGDGNDTLYGGGGNDMLIGGAGSDVMKGGQGDDTYIVESTGDTVIENFDEGTDTVRSSVSFTLGSNIENLIFTGTGAFTGVGNNSNNVIRGGDQGNTLNGMAGNDTLVGGAGNDKLDGGVGVDVMSGGGGDDTYVVANAADIVNEDVGGGNDNVTSSVSWALTAGSEVETIIALAGTTAINLTGNEFANTLVGNAGKNLLDGGAGADTMTGGAGDDTYVVDNAGDKVVEAAAGGTDTVRTTLASYTVVDNVENLTYTGTGDFHGAGNALANIITGGAGNDVLDGGAGNDTLVGGAGNDTYYVDSSSDKVTELAGGGIDTVYAAANVASYTLAAEVENLTYVGSNAFSGTGNASDNTITGGSGDNTLSGMAGNDRLYGGGGNDSLSGGDGNDFLIGGVGADKLAGGAGADTFVFKSVGDGGDTITDFDPTQDRIQLSGAGFDIHAVSDLHFYSSATNPVATAAGPALLYNTKTGALYFDDDGSGGHAAVLLATLSTHPVFDLSDIIVGP